MGVSSADSINAQLRYLSDLLMQARVTLSVIGPALSASEANLFNSTLTQGGPQTLVDQTQTDANMSAFNNGDGVLKFFALSVASGGHSYSARNDIDAEIGRSVDEGGTYYTLSYRPTNASNNPKAYRKIRVTVTRPGLTVQTRNGYFAQPAQTAYSPRRFDCATRLRPERRRHQPPSPSPTFTSPPSAAAAATSPSTPPRATSPGTTCPTAAATPMSSCWPPASLPAAGCSPRTSPRWAQTPKPRSPRSPSRPPRCPCTSPRRPAPRASASSRATSPAAASAPSTSHPKGNGICARLLLPRALDGAHHGARFVGALGELVLWDRVGDEASAGLDVSLLAVHEERADGDARI